MTVLSLWKVLDGAQCARAVDEKELVRNSNEPVDINPWNFNEHARSQSKPPCLAVDLSIWICESLTSSGMNENHANPALHLVFSRTVKLLSLGIRLIFVIEGKRRIRTEASEADMFRKRRSGSLFWKACRDCQVLLEMLGVPVVKAKTEGEALCALLSQRGVVDGVISNDGDCLLFGAKVLYTKFSIENLEQGLVMRYDLSALRATVEGPDNAGVATIPLSRQDLISFALLTGSDLAGAGLDKVGYKKAIRFIHKCQLDYPMSPETATIDEIKAWARAAEVDNGPCASVGHEEKAGKLCSRCSHPGSKRSHAKHGCDTCETAPGEPCYQLTTEDRFRKSLRAKALAMRPKFEPSKVFKAYMRPNEDQMPSQLVGKTADTVVMTMPRFSDLAESNLIVKGRSLQPSQEYVRRSVARLMARCELLRSIASPPDTQPGTRPQEFSRNHPIPVAITRSLVHKGNPSYEIQWTVNASVSDENGDGIDGYEYNTVELANLIDRRYPKLVQGFKEAMKLREKQGDGEQHRRREFLESMLHRSDTQAAENEGDGVAKSQNRTSQFVKKRQGFFKDTLKANDGNAGHGKRLKRATGGDDVCNLLRFVGEKFDDSDPNIAELLLQDDQTMPHKKRSPQKSANMEQRRCQMGFFWINITPIKANFGSFPPRHIFVWNADKKDGSLPSVPEHR